MASDLDVQSLAFDSRQVQPGTLFFAVPGTQVDGHDYLDAAFAAGAAGAVVERREVFQQRKNCILVADVRGALARAADRWFDHPSGKLKLVGVTGTNGKTTCAFLLYQVWGELGLVPGLLGTVETRIGPLKRASSLTTPDPLTIQKCLREMVDAGVEWAAMEVSSIALDQKRTGGVDFAAGVFTNLTQDHLDYHQDMETYFRAKRRLFEEHQVGHRVLNGDDPWTRKHAGPTDKVFGFGTGANFRIGDCTYSMLGSECELATLEGTYRLKTPLIGAHNLANCAAVVAAATALGLDTVAVVAALTICPGAPGRLERVHGDERGGPFVFVDYAHTEDALANVLDALAPLKAGGRLWTVFGCGGDRDRQKRPRMATAVSRRSDVSLATSDNPRTEDPERILDDLEAGIHRTETQYIREVDRKKAIHLALEKAGPQDLVLIAGKGHEDYQVLGTEKIHFDDREVVRGFFSR